MKPRRIDIAPDSNTQHDHDRGVGGEEGRQDGPRTRGRSALLHPLAIVATLAVAGYALAAVALNLLVDTEAVRGWLGPRASATLNRPVSVGRARVALLPRPSIHVADVRVDDLGDSEGPALAFVERVRLDLRWLPLLLGRVSVAAVRLDGPRVYMAIDEEGVSNFGDLLPGRGQPVEVATTPVALGVAHLEVSGASISFFDAPEARSFTISGVDVRADLAAEGAAGWRADVDARSDSLLVRMASVTEEILRLQGPAATLTVRGDGTGRSVDIADGTLELTGEELGVRGRVSGLSGTRRSYDLQLTNDSLDAAVLAAAFPERLRSRLLPAFDGELGVTLQVTSARVPGRGPLVRGAMHLSDVSIRMSGKAMVDRLGGTIGVTPDSLVLDSLTGLFAEGPFELSGTLERGMGRLALASRAEPDLDALDRLGFVPDGTTLSGDASFDLALTGRLDALDSAQVAGTVRLSGVQAKHAEVAAPLYFPAGELVLLGQEVRWSDLTVLLGQDRLLTTGRVANVSFFHEDRGARAPRVEASVRAARLDLGALFPPRTVAADVTYARVAFAHLGARTLDGRRAASLVSALDLTRPRAAFARGAVTLEVDTLDFRRYRLGSVSARVELSDSSLVVEAPAFDVWGGTASGSLRLALGSRPGEPFELELRADSVAAVDFLSTLTPVQGAVTGALSVDLSLAGTLGSDLMPRADDLGGRASVSVRDGRIRGTGPNLVIADFLGSDEWSDLPFERWDSELGIEPRRLEVVSSRLRGEQADVALTGFVHLAGSHDLSVGLSIPPERLRTVSLRRTGIGQSVLDHLSAAGSSLELGLRVSGELRDPVVEPDASNAVALAR